MRYKVRRVRRPQPRAATAGVERDRLALPSRQLDVPVCAGRGQGGVIVQRRETDRHVAGARRRRGVAHFHVDCRAVGARLEEDIAHVRFAGDVQGDRLPDARLGPAVHARRQAVEHLVRHLDGDGNAGDFVVVGGGLAAFLAGVVVHRDHVVTAVQVGRDVVLDLAEHADVGTDLISVDVYSADLRDGVELQLVALISQVIRQQQVLAIPRRLGVVPVERVRVAAGLLGVPVVVADAFVAHERAVVAGLFTEQPVEPRRPEIRHVHHVPLRVVELRVGVVDAFDERRVGPEQPVAVERFGLVARVSQ